jgi:transposase
VASDGGVWRWRFVESRLDGLADEPRPGAPRTISEEAVEEVIVATLERQPKDATHWSRASMAHESGLSKSTVGRIWKAFGLKPHQVDTFKISSDPQLIDKVRDVVGGVHGCVPGIGEDRTFAGEDHSDARRRRHEICVVEHPVSRLLHLHQRITRATDLCVHLGRRKQDVSIAEAANTRGAGIIPATGEVAGWRCWIRLRGNRWPMPWVW